MTPRVELNEDTQTYEFGDDVEGVFIAFATIPKTSVESRVQSVLDHQEAHGTTTAPAAGGAESSADYTDNGDGSYTRSSDGVTGRFGPAGFTADKQS